LRRQGITLWGLVIGLAGVLALGMTGAIIALGDTLYPTNTLAEALQQDIAIDSPFPIRLRLWHPSIAIIVGFYLLFVSGLLAMFSSNPQVRRYALALAALFVMQLAAGVANVLLLAPVWMQLVHLLLADLVWITLVLFSASILNTGRETAAVLVEINPSGPNPVGFSER